MSEHLDLVIIGSGPSGLACAIEAARHHLRFVIIEKGCVVNAIYNFPANMTFFTTGKLLEIGNMPMTVLDTEKPKRRDALTYYRRVVDHYDLPLRDFEKVVSIEGEDGDFTIRTENSNETEQNYRCKKVIVAIGYYDNPNVLGIPGEHLDKVSHYYTEPHPYYRKKVAVVGGKNSAAIAALELYRVGAEVVLIHRGPKMSGSVKYWILPDINNRLKNGEIKGLFQSELISIALDRIEVSTPEGNIVLENDFVFLMTGYHPDISFLQAMGIQVDSETLIPSHDPQTLESNVAGIYLAGSVVSGKLTNKIFIETGRFHGEKILPHLIKSLRSGPSTAD